MIKKLRNFDHKILIECLRATGKKQTELFQLARRIKEEIFGRRIWFRGLIEFSNLCRNDCYYCGIRRSNAKPARFQMSLKEIDDGLKFIKSANYGSVVFQSGELVARPFKERLLKIVEATRKKYPDLGITVSCGEQAFAYLKKLKAAGASRYLLRIETASQKLYKKLHPSQMSWEKRFQCLKDLQKLNYQVGTGIMVGLPGQTDHDLIGDLKFFVDNKFDMFGLGPYVIHKDTPLGGELKTRKWWRENKEKNFNKFLNFLAILRVLSPRVNIAAATACDVFHPLGRIKVLEIAGNVIMPSVTPKNYRHKYLLYQDKPCLDEDARKCLGCLALKIKKAGLEPVFGERGNSPFYYQRIYGQAQRI